MALRELVVQQYRSIRDLRLQLRPVNVLTGPNGCGKSNLYNSMFLLSKAAAGGFARAIAEEGGMPSVLWAGEEKVRYTRRRPPRRVILRVTGNDYSYELQFGLPDSGPPTIHPTEFKLDPRIKEETVALADSRVKLMQRNNSTAHI